jgi:hypothetical protein
MIVRLDQQRGHTELIRIWNIDAALGDERYEINDRQEEENEKKEAEHELA